MEITISHQKKLSLFLLLLVICAGSLTAFGQTSAFTYQGRLTDGGAAATLNNMAGFNWIDQQINSNGRFPFITVGSVTPGAGTWTVGACIRNTSTTTLNNNDWLNGWIMVTKN